MTAADSNSPFVHVHRPGRAGGNWTRTAAFAFSGLALAFVTLMLATFVWQVIPIWRQSGLQTLIGKSWFFRHQEFGALPMIYGTLVVSTLALLLAGPVGFGAALYSAEVLPARWRPPVKIAIELLAGIPSVIYGLLGILLLRDWVYRQLEPFDPLSGDTLLTAALLLAVMVLPTVTTLSDDALRGVPAAQRRAARGLGLTRAEMVVTVCLPQAWRGMVAALLLAFGRALGEGIAVFMVVGRQDNQWPPNLLSLRPWIEAGQTLNSKLVSSETHLAQGNPLHWAAIVNLGLLLLAMTTLVVWLGARLLRRREPHATDP